MPGTHGQLMKKGVNFSGEGSGGTQSQDITYSDFENLSQAQKDNGTIYFIPDYPLPTVAIKPWATATDAELVAMVQAADAGDIDLYEDADWRVGDERVVHLSAMSATGVGESHAAQDVTFVLMHRGLYKDVNDKTVNFVVGMKDCLAEEGYMNSTNTSVGSWSASARRAWCNNVFKNALPSTLLPIFKQVKVTTAQTYGGSTNEITNDYFFLPAGAEVYKGDSEYGTGGSAGRTTGWTNLTEFNALTRFDYYATTSDRIKRVTVASTWWERSVFGNGFCFINPDGTPYSNATATNNFGLSIHGCI